VAQEVSTRALRRAITALVQRELPCGTGFCSGCPVETRGRRMRLACTDGPAFELRDLY